MERLTISKVLQIAEEQTAVARRAAEAGDLDASDLYERWSETLSLIRIMKERGVPDSLKDEEET